MKLDWNKVISNAVTVLVTAVFMGAAIQLWNGVQTIDTRIDSNLVEIKATQEVLSEQVDTMNNKLAEILPLILNDDTFKEPKGGTKNLIDERVQLQIQQREFRP
tara:strand:+ start:2174 stop:2485 length:312 start_codon:yes stop_codon:yes gene_type:complete